MKSFKNKFPINEKKYLLKYLNPTSPGTKYWESPPPKKLNHTDISRIIIQVHQFFSVMEQINYDIKNKSLLDVGCGNGMVSNLIFNFSNLKKAIGADPYSDGEHTTSWQKLDHKKLLKLLHNKILKEYKSVLDINNYRKDLSQEDYSLDPGIIKIRKYNNKMIKIHKIGAHDLKNMKSKFDIIYCKAIEHISNWNLLAKNFSKVTKKNGIIFFKHRSFFSYLGPHRYGSTAIPWGHVLLKDKELIKYIKKYYPERQKQFMNFMYNEINYPRETVDDLIKYFTENNFTVHSIINESARYQNEVTKLIKEVPFFWKNIKKNYPNVSYQELFSGVYTIVFKKTN